MLARKQHYFHLEVAHRHQYSRAIKTTI